MIIALTGAGLNIVLDFILIYGIKGWISPLYLEGAAWGSLIAQGVMAVMALVFLLTKTNISLALKFPLHPELGRLIVMSLNLFVRTLALNIALILAVREATALGDKFIGAHTIAINLWLFSAFFIDGYSAAGNSMGGKLLGERKYDGLWILVRKIVTYGFVVSMALTALGFIFYFPIGHIFSNDLSVLEVFYSIFFIVILGIPINMVAFIFDGLFKGLGEMKYLRNVLLSATFLGFIPMLFLSKYLNWDLYGIWIAFTIWMIIRGGALIWKFHRKFRPLPQNV